MIIKPQKPEELASFLKRKPLVLYGFGDTGGGLHSGVI